MGLERLPIQYLSFELVNEVGSLRTDTMPPKKTDSRVFPAYTFPGITNGGDRLIIGIDVHKLSESVCVTDIDGKIVEEYKMENTKENWDKFMGTYPREIDIVMEYSATGKYVAKLLRYNGFHIHLANPSALKIMFESLKKTDKNDARNLAKLFWMGELPESYIHSMEIDNIRSMIRYRRSLGEELTALKNRVLALLARNGLSVDASDIFGKGSLKKIL